MQIPTQAFMTTHFYLIYLSLQADIHTCAHIHQYEEIRASPSCFKTGSCCLSDRPPSPLPSCPTEISWLAFSSFRPYWLDHYHKKEAENPGGLPPGRRFMFKVGISNLAPQIPSNKAEQENEASIQQITKKTLMTQWTDGWSMNESLVGKKNL